MIENSGFSARIFKKAQIAIISTNDKLNNMYKNKY